MDWEHSDGDGGSESQIARCKRSKRDDRVFSNIHTLTENTCTIYVFTCYVMCIPPKPSLRLVYAIRKVVYFMAENQ